MIHGCAVLAPRGTCALSFHGQVGVRLMSVFLISLSTTAPSEQRIFALTDHQIVLDIINGHLVVHDIATNLLRFVSCQTGKPLGELSLGKHAVKSSVGYNVPSMPDCLVVLVQLQDQPG